MNIIVHCKNIEWDGDVAGFKRSKLPKTQDIKLDVDTDVALQPNMTLTQCIDEHLDNELANILSDDIYGFCVKSASYSWELDPVDLLKTLKKSAKHTLTKWKAAHKKLKDGKMSADDYLQWMQENLTDAGLTGETDNFTGEPISISTQLTP